MSQYARSPVLAPTNPAALVFLTMTMRPTFRAEFNPGEGGNNWGVAPSPWPARLASPRLASPRLATASLRHGESSTRRIYDTADLRSASADLRSASADLRSAAADLRLGQHARGEGAVVRDYDGDGGGVTGPGGQRRDLKLAEAGKKEARHGGLQTQRNRLQFTALPNGAGRRKGRLISTGSTTRRAASLHP